MSGDLSRKRTLRPQVVQRAHQMVNILIGVQRSGSDAQALGFHRHRRVIDRLDINAVIVQQDVADPFRLLGIPDHHRNDMAVIGHVGNAHLVETGTNLGNIGLLTVALGSTLFQMPD